MIVVWSGGFRVVSANGHGGRKAERKQSLRPYERIPDNAGALTGLCDGGYDWLTKAGWTMTQGAVFTVCCVISGAVFGGALMWFVQKALAKTGVLDRFESGNDARNAQ